MASNEPAEKQEKPSPVALARIGEEAKEINLATLDKKQFNVLEPTSVVRVISPYHVARMQIVRLSPDPQDGDVYKQGSRKVGNGFEDVLCLSKHGLETLADAAGIVWHWPECKRMDRADNRDYVSFQAVGGRRGPDGVFRAFKATKEIDMEVVEAEITEKWQGKIGQKIGFGNKEHVCAAEEAEREARVEALAFRKHKLARCETGAYMRVVRHLLRVKSNYGASEVAKPFVMARVDFAPDYNDPEVRAKVELAVLSQMQTDFGHDPTLPALPAGASREQARTAERDVERMKAEASPEWGPAEVAMEAELVGEEDEEETAGAGGSLF